MSKEVTKAVPLVGPAFTWTPEWREIAEARAAEVGHVICGARRKRDGKPCENHPTPERHRCRNHGGLTPRGLDSPHSIHFRYSKALPDRLGEKLLAAVTDESLTSLWDELALVDVRVSDLLEMLTEEHGTETWQRVARSLPTLRKHIGADETAEALLLLDRIDEDLGALDHEATTWQEVRRWLEQRRKLATAERQREEQLEATMTAKQAIVFQSAIKSALERAVSALERGDISVEDLRVTIGHELEMILLKNTGTAPR